MYSFCYYRRMSQSLVNVHDIILEIFHFVVLGKPIKKDARREHIYTYVYMYICRHIHSQCMYKRSQSEC